MTLWEVSMIFRAKIKHVLIVIDWFLALFVLMNRFLRADITLA
jgi:hypothetical protein